MANHPFDILPLQNGAQLLFTPCPGTRDATLEEAVKTLAQAGAGAVITLMPDQEIARHEVAALPSVCEAQGLDWFQLPVEDDCAPGAAFTAAFAQHRAELLQRLSEGQAIAIHCLGGSGRTGLMAAILLLESGMDWAEVEPSIKALRPKTLKHPLHLDYLVRHYAVSQ